MSFGNNLALISAPDTQRRNSFFPQPVVELAKTNGKAAGESTPGGTYLPLPYEAEKLLAGNRRSKFRLQRISSTEFSFVLEPLDASKGATNTATNSVELTLLSPDSDSYWGFTVCRGGDVWIELDPY
jgi:hypothetical protein